MTKEEYSDLKFLRHDTRAVLSVRLFLPMWQLPRAVVGAMFALMTLLSVGKKKLS